jgi:hypothetical protein
LQPNGIDVLLRAHTEKLSEKERGQLSIADNKEEQVSYGENKVDEQRVAKITVSNITNALAMLRKLIDFMNGTDILLRPYKEIQKDFRIKMCQSTIISFSQKKNPK